MSELQRYAMSDRKYNVNDAFQQLKEAIAQANPGTFVNDLGEPTRVMIEDFLLMSGRIDHEVMNTIPESTGEVFSFKHRITRNYIQIMPRILGSAVIEIPKTNDSFRKGTF